MATTTSENSIDVNSWSLPLSFSLTRTHIHICIHTLSHGHCCIRAFNIASCSSVHKLARLFINYRILFHFSENAREHFWSSVKRFNRKCFTSICITTYLLCIAQANWKWDDKKLIQYRRAKKKAHIVVGKRAQKKLARESKFNLKTTRKSTISHGASSTIEFLHAKIWQNHFRCKNISNEART